MENIRNPFALDNRVTPGWIPSVCFFLTWHDVEMCSFCLLDTMELILLPNCSMLYLDSSDTGSFTSVLLKKSYCYKYNCYKNPEKNCNVS